MDSKRTKPKKNCRCFLDVQDNEKLKNLFTGATIPCGGWDGYTEFTMNEVEYKSKKYVGFALTANQLHYHRFDIQKTTKNTFTDSFCKDNNVTKDVTLHFVINEDGVTDHCTEDIISFIQKEDELYHHCFR